MSEPSDEEIREILERNPKAWAELQEEAAKSLAEAGRPVTPELLDAEALAIFRRRSFDSLAKLQEFIPTEERRRIYREEEARLRWLYPEGFEEELVLLAAMQRFKEEYPDAF